MTYIHGQTLLVACIEPSNHHISCCVQSSQSPICTLVPDVLLTDNGVCIVHKDVEFTSSPRYLQSNGKANNTVKTVKWLFNKCRESIKLAQHPHKTSPAQRFLGRRCKTLLLTTTARLKTAILNHRCSPCHSRRES